MAFIKKLLLSSIFIFILPYFLKGIAIHGFLNALLFTLALAFLNSVVKPILILLSLPITVVTFGLFLIIINTGLVYMASYIVKGVYIDSFLHGIVFSIIISIITSIVDWVVSD
ncbi:MAG TPA: phage holin family protein [Bacteroidia bacterium]|nr:phage holin family protein [Bacteroidia bacterium]